MSAARCSEFPADTLQGLFTMQIVKFADRLNAIASNDDVYSKSRFTHANVPWSPIQAAAQSEHHAALLKSVIASARRLRIDFDPAKPVDIDELNAKLSKSSNYTERMALKKTLSLMGCLKQ
jgi:hypothetical protein